jgi:hypothetical protein
LMPRYVFDTIAWQIMKWTISFFQEHKFGKRIL